MEEANRKLLTEIKRRFFVFRNGLIADTLRQQGSPYRYIFGLNLPQLSEIAKTIPHSADMTMALIDNDNTRESQLIAPLVFPNIEMTETIAIEWLRKAKSTEAIDIFCLKQLRENSLAENIISEIQYSDSDLDRYAVLRLLFSLIPNKMDFAKRYALSELERNNGVTRFTAMQLLNEIEFIDAD